MAIKNDAQALQDYMEAYKKFGDFLHEYIPASPIVRGQETKYGKPIPVKVMDEMDRLEKNMEKKWNVWMNLLSKERKSA